MEGGECCIAARVGCSVIFSRRSACCFDMETSGEPLISWYFFAEDAARALETSFAMDGCKGDAGPSCTSAGSENRL